MEWIGIKWRDGLEINKQRKNQTKHKISQYYFIENSKKSHTNSQLYIKWTGSFIKTSRGLIRLILVLNQTKRHSKLNYKLNTNIHRLVHRSPSTNIMKQLVCIVKWSSFGTDRCELPSESSLFLLFLNMKALSLGKTNN